MVFKILKHDWLAFKRSPVWGQSVIQYFILTIFGLYLIGMLFSVGFMSQEILNEYYPNVKAKDVIFKWLIYYLIGEFVIRYMFQKFPSLSIKRYLTHNISKSSICHYLTSRSLFSYFNIAPFFLILPVYFKTIAPNYTSSESLLFLFMIILLVFMNHFITMSLDRFSGKDWRITFGSLAAISILVLLDTKGYFSLGLLTAPIFHFLSASIVGPIILILTIIFLYRLNYKLLKDHAYIDDGKLQLKEKEVTASNYTFFDRFGPEIGRLMELDTKLILRNKRTKSFLFACILFMLYPLLMSGGDSLNFNSNAFMIFMACFVVGSTTLNFGQIMISMNSSHFEFIIGQNINIRDYLKAKFTLLAISNLLLFILATPYAYFNSTILLINAMMCLFMTGVVIFTYMFMSFASSKKFEINQGSMFNFQGFGAAHYLMILPIMGLPIAIYFLFRAFDMRIEGIIAIGLIGLIGIITRDYWLKKAERIMHQKKHIINANFKK